MLSNIADFVKKIVTLLSGLLDNIKSFFKSILDFLKLENLKKTFFDIFKYLFVPSDDFFTKNFNELKQAFSNKFNIDSTINSLNELKSVKAAGFSDIYMLGQKVVDMSFLNQSIVQIKKYTDWFFWLLLALYHYNQIYYLVRGTYPIRSSGKGSDD